VPLARRDRPKHVALYKCWRTFSADDIPAEFPDRTVPVGLLLLGSHPAVQAHPECFVLATAEGLAGRFVEMTPAELAQGATGPPPHTDALQPADPRHLMALRGARLGEARR
jgi:hypothetical protein